MKKIVVNVQTGESAEVDMSEIDIAQLNERIALAEAVAPIAEMARLEQENPITHRGQREFYIGFGDAFPQFKETHLYKEAKRVDDLIRAERAKL